MALEPHYRGTYQVQARLVRAHAYGNPGTRCWRCGHTMAEIQTKHPRAKWTAGHLIDGQVNGFLAAECSPCNFAAGGRLRHEREAQRRHKSTDW